MQGQRLADTMIGDFPVPYDEMPLGSYWKVLDRKTGEPLRPDAGYWGEDDPPSNLTDTVWGVITPYGQYGMLSLHTVREEEDGTISVRAGDGSSNSILVSGPHKSDPGMNTPYHGYIEHGVWSEC